MKLAFFTGLGVILLLENPVEAHDKVTIMCPSIIQGDLRVQVSQDEKYFKNGHFTGKLAQPRDPVPVDTMFNPQTQELTCYYKIDQSRRPIATIENVTTFDINQWDCKLTGGTMAEPHVDQICTGENCSLVCEKNR